MCSKLLLIISALGFTSANADTTITTTGTIELGALGVHQHKIKFGKEGTRFDYRNDGNQDNLYPFQRFDMTLKPTVGGSWQFIYNPLEFKTKTTLKKQTTIDGTSFDVGRPIDLTYSFPFYRLSYCADPCNKKSGFYYGGGLQIRNASIIFEDSETSQRVVKQNVGPVPLVMLGLGFEAMGGQILLETNSMYAPVKVLNGSDSDVVGGFSDSHFSYLIDTSSTNQAGIRVRYLGGGAQGTNENDLGGSDGYTSNWIDIFAFSFVLSGQF